MAAHEGWRKSFDGSAVMWFLSRGLKKEVIHIEFVLIVDGVVCYGNYDLQCDAKIDVNKGYCSG